VPEKCFFGLLGKSMSAFVKMCKLSKCFKPVKLRVFFFLALADCSLYEIITVFFFNFNGCFFSASVDAHLNTDVNFWPKSFPLSFKMYMSPGLMLLSSEEPLRASKQACTSLVVWTSWKGAHLF
jgi:hypothetical protein